MKALLDIVASHKRGTSIGIYSLCSAHELVIESALRQAQISNAPLLVEATSNQVNQFGGYTGMTPADFRRFVLRIAERLGFPSERLWLGGDHLGPNAWRCEAADKAMAHAVEMVAQYVAAGFRKIHLDCSVSCADDEMPLPEATIAARAARLCAAAESAWRQHGGEAPVYVIGTEVPVPGGAEEELTELKVTEPAAVAETIEAHRRSFLAAGLGDAWSRVIALVVQPGVEFDHHKVIDYLPAKARALRDFIGAHPQFVYEAHSTDYQTPANLRALVGDHFAVLKVGPAATFALRETLWALAAIEQELPGLPAKSGLRQVVAAVMQADDRHWRDYYRDAGTEAFDRAFSLSDRVRYYWPHPDVQRACAAMLDNLRQRALPLTLVSQFLPLQYTAVRAGQLTASVDALLDDGIASALRPYVWACSP